MSETGWLFAAGTLALLTPRGIQEWLAARARRFRLLLDHPGGRKSHCGRIPMVGGPSLLAGTVVGSLLGLVGFSAGSDLSWKMAAVAALFAVGLLDDLGGKRMSAGAKAAATLLVLILYAGLLPGENPTWLLAPAFLVLHSFNTSDNMNGLAAGMALTGTLVLAVAGPMGLVGPGTAIPSAALAGGLAVFLVGNLRGQRFLGDSGSLLLGGWFACTFLEQRHPATLLLGALPVADLVTVALLRWRAGGAPWIGDRRHVSHRLAAGGLGEGWAVLLLVLAQLLWALGTLFLLARTGGTATDSWPLTLLALTLACAVTAAVRPSVGSRRRSLTHPRGTGH